MCRPTPRPGEPAPSLSDAYLAWLDCLALTDRERSTDLLCALLDAHQQSAVR